MFIWCKYEELVTTVSTTNYRCTTHHCTKDVTYSPVFVHFCLLFDVLDYVKVIRQFL